MPLRFRPFPTVLLLFLLLFSACGDDDTSPVNALSCQSAGEWLVPRANIFDGGPGCDGIPALLNPPFTPVADVDYLNPEDLVSVAADGPNNVKLYAHTVLDWHEIINDDLGGDPVAVVYCPLTGTGMGWDRRLSNGQTTTFGVSGLLYNSNIIPYDRATRSNWSQQRLECVNGELSGERPTTTNLPEMRWRDARERFPDAVVTNYSTGEDRPYGRYPYGDYRTNDDNRIFPVEREDDRLPAKERVLGVVVNGRSTAYRYRSFPNRSLGLVTDVVDGRDVTLIGSRRSPEFMNAFYPRLTDGTDVVLELTDEEVLIDQLGNRYDLLGRVTAGPAAGQRLTAPTAFIGYWFSWGAFYPGIEIFEE